MRLLALLLTTSLFFSTVPVVYGQEGTVSPFPSPSVDPAVTTTLKERVQRVLEANPQIRGSQSSDQSTFGLVGTLEKIVGSTMQIRTYQQKNRVVEVAKEAVFLKSNKPIQKEELELNTPVIVMGTIEDNTYIGRRFIVTDDTIFPTARQTIWATAISTTTRNITVSLFGASEGSQATFPINTQTSYVNLLGTKIVRGDIKPSTEVILVIPGSDATATASARRVYSLTVPQTAQIAP